MGSPVVAAVLILLIVVAIAGTVILMLMPARQKILNDEPAENEARVSSQWAGGLDTPTHPGNVIHHDFGGHDFGGHGGGGPLH